MKLLIHALTPPGDATHFQPAAMAIVVGCLLAWQLLRSRVRAKPLMTRIEREVLHHIEVAAPRCRIHGQVCLGALLQLVRWLPGNARRRSRYGYANKIVDFVVDDRASGEVLALVEPNDRSHDRRADRAHDRLTARAGYLTIQLPASENPTRANVAARIAAGLRNRRQDRLRAIVRWREALWGWPRTRRQT